MKKGIVILAVLCMCLFAVPVMAEEAQPDVSEIVADTWYADVTWENVDALAIMMQLGQRGSDVSSLQQMLNSLGYNTGGIDGVYGDQTDAAVRAFQSDFDLAVDGIAGDNTVGMLVSRTQDTDTQQTSAYTGNLSYGSGERAAVTELQTLLNQMGYQAGAADGAFGSMTEAAVRQYQADHGLYVDGIVGPQTMSMLRSQTPANAPAVTPSADTQPAADAQETSFSSGYLAYGMSGSQEVTKLQSLLNKLGYNVGTADGAFGANTEAAVRKFQADNGLYVDGIAGTMTLASLTKKASSSGSSQTQTQTQTQESSSQTPVSGTLEAGMSGAQVRALQEKLAELGYPVTPDGEYGDQTTRAVKAFQRLNGLFEDGVFGNASAAVLNGSPAGYTEEEDTSEDSYLVTPDIVEHVRGIVNQTVTSDMTPNEKLWAVFDYIGNRNVYPYQQNRIPHYDGIDWPVVYSEDMMYRGGSDCHGTAALFGYAASMIGYDTHDLHWVSNGYHAWVDIDGLIYDPVFTNSSYHTTVFGYTYPQGQAAGLGAGFEHMEGQEGTFRYIRVPRIR